MTDIEAWPVEVRLRTGRETLALELDDGASYEISAELLRVSTPSAERKGHSPGEEKIIGGKRRVRIERMEPVGNYALRLAFDDGHATGIYTFPFLVDLAARADEHRERYLSALERAGLSRDHAGEALLAKA